MDKYLKWLFAALTSFTLTLAYAEDVTEEKETSEVSNDEDQVAVAEEVEYEE